MFNETGSELVVKCTFANSASSLYIATLESCCDWWVGQVESPEIVCSRLDRQCELSANTPLLLKSKNSAGHHFPPHPLNRLTVTHSSTATYPSGKRVGGLKIKDGHFYQSRARSVQKADYEYTRTKL